MSTGSTQPFAPSGTILLAAGAVGVSATMSPGDTVLVYNSSAGIAFVTFGNGMAVPSVFGFPVPPGASRLIYVGPIVNTVAALLSSGAGSVYVSAGTGTVY